MERKTSTPVKWMAAMALCCIMLSSCDNFNKKDSSNNIAYAPGDDVELNAAIKEANDHYSEFLTAFNSKDTSYSDFTIKMRFDANNGGGEHIWMDNLQAENGEIYGYIDEEPVMTDQVIMGQRVKIDRSRVSDWVFLKDGEAHGGYTIKVLMKRQKKKEVAPYE